MNQRIIKIGAKYRHFKGNEYLILHLAKKLWNHGASSSLSGAVWWLWYLG